MTIIIQNGEERQTLPRKDMTDSAVDDIDPFGQRNEGRKPGVTVVQGGTANAATGIRAFVERRAAVFQGR
jgi:hypothetical protein